MGPFGGSVASTWVGFVDLFFLTINYPIVKRCVCFCFQLNCLAVIGCRNESIAVDELFESKTND